MVPCPRSKFSKTSPLFLSLSLNIWSSTPIVIYLFRDIDLVSLDTPDLKEKFILNSLSNFDEKVMYIQSLSNDSLFVFGCQSPLITIF
jgi:hypothetical protein